MTMLIACFVCWVMCAVISYCFPHYAPAGETIAICLVPVGLFAGVVTALGKP
ncbi:hypothetical protein [Acetobacter aceti]|uniref:hypothetical protein n=1 Tax=Acetobacter aceti TaxID=435 RepID=UPI0015E09361|nr:hypothetical protein [Acetobacter aceti]